MIDAAPTVLVVGGTGYFGRLLIGDLLCLTDAQIVLTGRSARRFRGPLSSLAERYPQRLFLQELQLHDEPATRRLVQTSALVICAAGPFQSLPTTLVTACLERGVHYLDLSDDRDYVRRVRRRVDELERLPTACVCTGWSAVPALSGLLARIASADFSEVDSIDIHLAPGNRSPRGIGTVASLLHSVGRPFDGWENGRMTRVVGWSDPKAFDFPRPVGRRIGYVVETPDYDVLPPLFNAKSVSFRVGAQIHLLNRLVSVMGWLVRGGLVQSLAPWTPILRRAMAMWGFLGDDSGGVGVRVTGHRNGADVARTATIVAAREGQRIPVMPAAVMAARLLAHPTPPRGLIPVDNWLSREALHAACAERGFKLSVDEA